MLQRIGDCILTKLGFGTRANYMAVRNGLSGVEPCCAGTMGIPEPFMASLMDRSWIDEQFMSIGGNRIYYYTPFEKVAILATHRAIGEAKIDAAAPDVLFVLSTTKGNVELLDTPNHPYGENRLYLWRSAQLLAQFFGNTNTPVVVSNACISGVCAQIQADRLLSTGKYTTAIVIGAEMLSKFVVSGFQSFKALSSSRCRPFDATRDGLNLGEGAACIVYKHVEANTAPAPGAIRLLSGAIRNDANHISGPSRTGEGLHNAIDAAMRGINPNQLAFVSAHGTATPYNDEMESIALSRSGMLEVPVFSLKPHFGHTLGAAGVLETIIGFNALTDGEIPASMGFETTGTSHAVNISAQPRSTNKSMFMKLLSGFGGCNAAMVVEHTPINTSKPCE